MNKKAKERIGALEVFCAEFGGKVEVYDTFVDDTLLGCVALFGPNKVKIAFPWCGWPLIAALQYASECRTAWEHAREEIVQMNEDVGELTDPKPWSQ